MTYRILCESNFYQGAVIYAGTLELNISSCPTAPCKANDLLPNAEHKPETINADLLALEGVTLPQKIVSFLNLTRAFCDHIEAYPAWRM